MYPYKIVISTTICLTGAGFRLFVTTRHVNELLIVKNFVNLFRSLDDFNCGIVYCQVFQGKSYLSYTLTKLIYLNIIGLCRYYVGGERFKYEYCLKSRLNEENVI